MSNAMLARLRAARAWHAGTGPAPGYADLRMIEKKGWVVLYRRLGEKEPYTAIVTRVGYKALGVDPFTGEPLPPSLPSAAWRLD